MGNLVLLGRYLSLQGCAQSSKSHQALESSRLQQFQVHKRLDVNFKTKIGGKEMKRRRAKALIIAFNFLL